MQAADGCARGRSGAVFHLGKAGSALYKSDMHYGVIMAGGSGTRLWPMSRASKPKQLLSIIEGKSLLRLSYERLASFLPPERILVCTSATYGQQVRRDLPELPAGNLLGEPIGRDTANAVGLPAAVLLKRDPEAVFAVVTADHVIRPVDRFAQAIKQAFEVTEQYPEALVTFGIRPTFPHTGLGYVQRAEAIPLKSGATGAFRVKQFKEKPDLPTAQAYVSSGEYAWNSGMFVWRAQTILEELRLHLPKSYDGLSRIAADWSTPAEEETLRMIYPTLPKISIDFAVMEPASLGKGKASVMMVDMPVNWLDVGSWPALAEVLKKDQEGNTVEGALTYLVDSRNNIVVSDDPQHLISTVGMNDMILVHTRNATMICPVSESQRVKELAQTAKEKFGVDYA
jgi:mannose-1-phosphate guanylyltransferase